MLKYDTIYIEGIDKTCKDLLCNIICKLSNYKYVATSRGLISMMVYARMYGRDYEYNLNHVARSIQVYINTYKTDWEVRCKQSNEPPIDFEKHTQAFRDMIDYLKNKLGSKLKLLEFNVSEQALYAIAKQIVAYADSLNERAEEE